MVAGRAFTISRGDLAQGAIVSLDVFDCATLEWVFWLDNCRLLAPFGNIPPAETEAAYFASLEEAAIAA